MTATLTIQEKIAAEYDGLSAKLRDAADFVAENPLDVATRSLRSISASTGLAPATFSRLARALGFETYEDMRELSRSAVGRQVLSFSEKARRLQEETARGEVMPFHQRQAAAVTANIEASLQTVDPDRLEQAVERLHAARNVVLFGALGSTGIAEYMAYMGNYFATNWILAGRMGASLSSTMADLGPQDAMIVITKPPFAKRAILAAEMAAAKGVYLVVITDTHACPALKHASAGFILPSDSPQFFSSYAATLVLLETIVGMLVARSGPEAKARIEDVVARSTQLEEFWAPQN
ncbi:MurR/RpiR family transcriptional regulator [Actibacterium sp. XHP0104]|uniref:MurR/RpiR family transcriptional regulator n=1 Tax=Actibacterium sp. XHP0104 TaxID=2984335 RepID=UPI0021E71934|nr:MurR/RpiR family transcriptional regulator [Actibacterium sp. XHP0104]MCV2882699.1 MurR/RpiR family transcriptional regulator [Actibacterium sp. XHP0104]